MVRQAGQAVVVGGGGGTSPFGLLRATPLFSLCFPSVHTPAVFQASPDCVQGDKRADEREVSGGRGSSCTDTVAAGGRPRGALGQELGPLPATSSTPLRGFTCGSQNPFSTVSPNHRAGD